GSPAAELWSAGTADMAAPARARLRTSLIDRTIPSEKWVVTRSVTHGTDPVTLGPGSGGGPCHPQAPRAGGDGREAPPEDPARPLVVRRARQETIVSVTFFLLFSVVLEPLYLTTSWCLPTFRFFLMVILTLPLTSLPLPMVSPWYLTSTLP